MPGELSDEELMLRFAATGEAAAFEHLWTRNLAGLKRHLFHLCGDDRIAEDLAQEVWIRIFNAAGRYRPTARFRTYMFQIAHNLFIDHCRRSGRLAAEISLSGEDGEAIAERLPAAGPEPAAVLDRERQAAALAAAIAALPLAQRQVMLLYLDGCDLASMADILGRPFETVKTQYRYGLAKLKARAAGRASAESA
jgi:RNA polymerase sigma-70 factor (ECF subfamily)